MLQDAIFAFSQERTIVTAAGRTDSGVHALTQVAHFDLKKKIKKKIFLRGVNQHIGNKPVTVLNIKKVNQKFHARFDAKKRTYEYIIVNRQSPLALEKNKAWHIRKKLNIKEMKKGAKLLKGTHDFSTFRASSCQAKSPVKTLKKASVKKSGDRVILKFTSKSFLQQQVRSMVGCIKYLGDKKWNLKDFSSSFKSKNRFKCAPPAPACGLYLKKISY